MFIRFVAGLFAILFTFSVQAQQTTGSVSGKITDKAANKPLAFATVNVLKSDSSVAGGFITQEDGNFLISELMPGEYLLRVTYLGCKTVFVPNVKVSAGNTTPLGTVLIEPAGITKKEVVITAERNVITSNAEKKVFNVDPSLNPGASAADVLQQIPSVTTDQDGNINLRGEGSVMILIDGKPSALSGSGGNLLQQINASSIEKIEVITNPSAKFDAEGANGIINIILKKNAKQGTNALLNTAFSSWNKSVAGLSLNHRGKKANTFLNANYRYFPVFTRALVERDYQLESNPFRYTQKVDGYSYPYNYSIRAGVDYTINDKSSISGSTLWGYNPAVNTETYNYLLRDTSLQYLQHDILFNRVKQPAYNFEHSLNYRLQLKKPSQVLSAAAAWSRNSDERDIQGKRYQINSDDVLLDSSLIQLTSLFKNKNDIAVAQLDYEQAVLKNWKLESGLKGTFRFIDNSYYGERLMNQVTYIDSNNNNILYNDQIYAAYSILSGSIQKMNIKAGLRAEQSFRSFTVLNLTAPFRDNYLNLFPSIFLSGKVNKSITASASYSKRINRPSVQTLNPFPDNNDPNNQIRGNPYILPEMIHAVEAGAQWSGTSSSFNLTLYARQTVNKIQRIRTTEGLISTIRFVNLNSALNSGAEGVWRYDWAKWINSTLSANAYSIVLNSGNVVSAVNDRGWAWTGKLLLIVKPLTGFDIQINSNYNSPFITPQGKIKAIYYTDISLKKDVLQKRGSLTLGLTDIFDTRQFAIDTFFENITQDVIRKRESRILTIGFNYKFGKGESTQRRKSNVGEEFGGGGGE